MLLDLGNNRKEEMRKKETVRKTHTNKQKWRREGATGSHITHNNKTRNEDNSQNGEWRRKDRQSTAEKGLRKCAFGEH